MNIDREEKYVGAENQECTYPCGFVFPRFSLIEIESEETEGISQIFPKSDARAEGKSDTTVPLIITDEGVEGRESKFVDKLDEHTFPRPDIRPPPMCLKGFDDDDFAFKVVDLMSDLMEMDILDLVNCDISENEAVKHYEKVLMDKDTYLPVVDAGNKINQPLNDFISSNLRGSPVRSVLDCGAGKGVTGTRLDRHGCLASSSHIDFVEPNTELAAICEENFLQSGATFRVHNMDMSTFFRKHRDKKYDLIVANNSIHFICDSHESFIDDVFDALTDNGCFKGAFPNYDSLYFRPYYGCVPAGLVRAYFNKSKLWMDTDIAGIRRKEPVFPFWKLMEDKWVVEFFTGGTDGIREKEVISCFTTFCARKRRVGEPPPSFHVQVSARASASAKAEFVRPSFMSRKSGRPVVMKVADVPPPNHFYSKGKAVTWGDFFALRSMTLLATSKTDGLPGHLFTVNGNAYVHLGKKVYSIGERCDLPGVVQIEAKMRDKMWLLVLVEDQSTAVFLNQFNRSYPSFLYLKDYLSVVDVPSIQKMLTQEKEGLIFQGCFSGTAYAADTMNATHVKWNPTIDLRDENGVKEYFLDGRLSRVREDKDEGNDLESILSVATNVTPQSLFAVLSLPIDLTPFEMAHRNLISYPFGIENYIERNAFVGSYFKGLFTGTTFAFPTVLLESVAHKWGNDLWGRVQRLLDASEIFE